MGELLIRRREMILPSSTPPIPEPVLPTGYQRIEYINRPAGTSSTRAYNQTGFTPNNTDNVEVRVGFMCIGLNGTEASPVCSGNGANNNKTGLELLVTADKKQIGCWSNAECYITPNGGNSVEGIRYDVVATWTPTGLSFTDGTHSNSVSATTRTHARNFCVFGLKKYNQDAVDYPFFGNIYYLIILEAGVVKVYQIPAKRISDGAVGFYGMDGVFRSSGYYVAGPDVT